MYDKILTYIYSMKTTGMVIKITDEDKKLLVQIQAAEVTMGISECPRTKGEILVEVFRCGVDKFLEKNDLAIRQ